MRKIEKLENVLRQHGKITIIGHNNIDVDAFLSGILVSHLLNKIHIENEFVILQEVKEDDTYQIVKEMFQIDMKEYYSEKEEAGRNLLLEDHYETEHDGKVVACIDHHPTSVGIEYPFYYSKISCSTSYMVYELMQECNYTISQEEAKMILLSMMIDTVSFRSSKTVNEEKIEAKKIAKQYNLNYEELEKYCLCLTPIENVSVESIINNGYKYYNYSGNKVKSSYLQLYGMVEDEVLAEWLINIVEKIPVEELEMWVFIIFECKDNRTYEYQITKGKVETIVTNGILSRGTNIMPKIEALFQR